MSTTPNGAALPGACASPLVTADLLRQIAPAGRELPALAAAMALHMSVWGVSTPRRVAAFLAQTGHESGGFTRWVENLNYSAKRLPEVWPTHFRDPRPGERISGPTFADGKRNPLYYAGNPERLGCFIYGGRMGNGPEESGDGFRFRGRGLIQLTGRANYQKLAAATVRGLNDLPMWLETPEGAVVSALWFWQAHGLNALADAGDIEAQTRRINGGLHGLEDRRARYAAAAAALGIA